MDWHTSLHFKTPKQEPLDCEATITSMVGETHEPICHVLKDELNESKHMPNHKNLVSAQKSKFSKSLFLGVRAFMHAIKKGGAFFIYALLATDVMPQQHEILSKYKGYKDVFEKKNVDTLLKH
jgi:hypothetical protein